MKTTLLTILTILGFSWTAQATQIRCYSNANAPVSHSLNGLWILEASVASDYRLRDVKLKNNSDRTVGSESKSVSYDRRVTQTRMFKLSADVLCNYDVELPRDFSKTKSFRASLDLTCDGMFDADIKMTCVQR